jgi:hypothetical protein
MSKLNTGEVSILTLTAVFAVACFLLGQSFSSVSAKVKPSATPKVDYCVYSCPVISLMVCPTDELAYTSDDKTKACKKDFGTGNDKYKMYTDKVLYTPEIKVSYNKDNKDPHKCHRPQDSVLKDDYKMTNDQIKSFKDDNAEWMDSIPTAPQGYDLIDGVCYPSEEEIIPTATPVATVTTVTVVHDGGGDGLGCANNDCSGNTVGASQVQVLGASTQVLGASTMAGTGNFAEDLYLAIMTLGGTLSAFGIKNLKKASSKK